MQVLCQKTMPAVDLYMHVYVDRCSEEEHLFDQLRFGWSIRCKCSCDTLPTIAELVLEFMNQDDGVT
jgi:hypothetical protein